MIGTDKFTIKYDTTCYSRYGGKPCKHSENVETVVHNEGSPFAWTETVWVCKRMVYVEGLSGFMDIGLCVDCILEKVNEDIWNRLMHDVGIEDSDS